MCVGGGGKEDIGVARPLEVEDGAAVAAKHAVVLAVAVRPPKHCLRQLVLAQIKRCMYVLIVLSIDPDAIRFPVGSNLAVKISPECPDNSINGACNELVRGACGKCEKTTTYAPEVLVKHTVWMSAPLPDAPWRVRARLVPTFCRFTTNCP